MSAPSTKPGAGEKLGRMRFFLPFLLLWSSWLHARLIDAPMPLLDARQNPSGLEWAQLKTAHFRVIFPRSMETEARRVAGMLEGVYLADAENLKVSPRRWDIILQAHLLDSNGFVTLAPSRSEFFTTPWMGPELGQTEWLRGLAVHEFRHIVQFDKSREGFARFLRVWLGELGVGIAIGLTLPPWYLEGDAVGMETALSSGGRGRLPGFARDLRALLLDGQDYHYDKMALGSYKDFTPSHYVLGYFLTTHLRLKYGRDVLEKIHASTMVRAYNPLSFFNAVAEHTGKDFDDVYAEALTELTRLWRAQQALIREVPAQTWHPREARGWTNYAYPSALPDGAVLAYRSGLGHIGQFVRVEGDGREELLWTPAPLLQPFPFKLRAGKLAYAETVLHPRWGAQELSRVRVRDVVSGEEAFASEAGGWLLPVLDQRAQTLAVFSWESKGAPSLRVMDAKGKEFHRVPWSRQEPVMGMDWVPGTRSLVVLHRRGAYELVFSLVDPTTGAKRPLAASTRWTWAHPVASTTHVYFQSNGSGIDNIHRLPLEGGPEERVTSERHGAHHPSWGEAGLTYARYTPDGLRPARLAPEKIQPMPPGPDTQPPLYEALVQQEGKGDLLAGDPASDVQVRPYSLPAHAWNPHSWFFLAPPFGSTVTGMLRSTDVLNTVEWTNGASWDLNERTAQAFSSLRWSYLWPLFDLRAAFGNRRETDIDLPGFPNEDKWEEGSAELGMTLPWRRLHGRWSSLAQLRGFGGLLHAHGRQIPELGELGSESLSVGGVEASWSTLQRRAQRDLMAPWGFQVSGLWKEGSGISYGGGERSLQQWASVRAFVPGILPHHHLYGEYTHEERGLFGYHFPSPTLFPRGWRGRFLERANRTSANYAFPLAYPDWRLTHWLYLKRVSFNAFHDNLWGQRYLNGVRYESRGGELWFDTHFLRNAFPLQWGVRYSVPTDRHEDPSVELFLNTGLSY